MPRSRTTSIRLSRELSRELSRRARSTKRGKNWIIKEALEQYLLGSATDRLRQEVMEQSLRVSRQENRDEKAWLDHPDEVKDWRG